jgi:carbonic anhydrase
VVSETTLSDRYAVSVIGPVALAAFHCYRYEDDETSVEIASRFTAVRTGEGDLMSRILDEVIAANAAYSADFGDKSSLPMPPARRFAILTCMDARLDPAKFAGLVEGDAHVIRNAGGRASDDAIRSLVISHKLLGTSEWFIIHHTNCGMEYFTNKIMRELLERSLTTATLDAGAWCDTGAGPGSRAGEFIEWLTIDDQDQSVRDDVERIASHPLVSGAISIYGFIYDVRTGALREVAGARRIGAHRPAGAVAFASAAVPGEHVQALGATEDEMNMRGTVPQRIDTHGSKVEDLAGIGKHDAPGG